MRRSRAFTLIELMVVVAIIGLLVGITMPSLKEARRVARKSVCQKNLQQIGTGIHEYLQIHRDAFFEACQTPWIEAGAPVSAQRPSLPVALKTELAGADAFECPADRILDEPIKDSAGNPLPFQRCYDYDLYAYGNHSGKEGRTSYEWWPYLNGKRLTFKGIWYEFTDPATGRVIRELRRPYEQKMVYDFEPFHGGKRRIGSRNVLYADLRVQSE